MRISFPNGEHADVVLTESELSIGSGVGCDVKLAAAALPPRLVALRADPQRGVLLQVQDAAAPVFVNGRGVHEFALLRMGDVVSLGSVQLLVKPDRDSAIVVQVPAAQPAAADEATRASSSRVVLRGVAGAYYGRSIALLDPVTIGRSASARIRIDDPDMPELAGSFEIHGDRVLFRGGAAEAAVVNGVPVADAVLHPGDQIAIDVHRFVLEAPGLPARGSAERMPVQPGAHAGSTQTLRAVRADAQVPAAAKPAPAAVRRSGLPLGWLLLAGVAIAAALTAFFLYGPRGG